MRARESAAAQPIADAASRSSVQQTPKPSITIMKPIRPLLALCAALSLSAASVRADSIVTEWNDVFLQAVRDVKFGPPQTARGGGFRPAEFHRQR